ncbi:cell division protein FtsA [Clostridium minihomine]|uniref:cell division protein FtsA n=1 Tax=Clostridium minihomine TaxID=2045012 RepID=UPI000C778BA1|nr:cell division protein FtsA [Clostridium minihomine]
MQEENRTGQGTAESAGGTSPEDYVFALDIGTRSIIGIVGLPREEKLEICAVEIAEHEKRAMIDGQIEDIQQVSRVAGNVKSQLEARIGAPLNRVCVAAAGRALRTQKVHYELSLPEPQVITHEIICRLEAGAIQQAEERFAPQAGEEDLSVFYLVGYSVTRYTLDNYPLANLLDHRGQVLTADVIATFLPREVVDSLYTAMQKCGLEVSSLTLEPIAAMNAAIPQNLRLLNLALVDIGAGTSDIAVSKDGGVVGYTMATIAGDEITETLMKEYLVDFTTAERMKLELDQSEQITFQDILGLEQQVPVSQLKEKIQPVMRRLAEEICQQILQANGEPPSAVFLVGGGSKLPGLCACVAELLHLSPARVALGGKNFSNYLTQAEPELASPEFATPLGIAVSSALNLISDSFTILLNGSNAKLFRSNSLSVLDVLLMNGYRYHQMMSRSGKSLVYELDGESQSVYGGHPTLAKIQLNGKEASLSDTVRAGDSIVFQPALPGEDARITLGEAADLTSPGSVFLRGQEFSLGTIATVNGLPGDPAQLLNPRDRIRTRPVKTLEQLLSFAGEPEDMEFTVNGISVPPHTLLHPGDQIQPRPLNPDPPQKETPAEPQLPAGMPQTNDAAASEPLPESEATSAQTDPLLPHEEDPNQIPAGISEQVQALLQQILPEPPSANTSLPLVLPQEPSQDAGEPEPETNSDIPEEESPSAEKPAASPEPEVSSAVQTRFPMRLTLNHSSVTLKEKTDRSPYCLIDMLNLVNIDLSTPHGSIVLRINGREAGYLDPLQEGDQVEIYWDGKTRNA